jgi:small subunit ribosomal protein S6
MRRYETIFIADPDLSDEERTPLLDRIIDLIPEHDGFLVLVDEWGSKKLAYEINKKVRGYYIRLDYCGTGTLVGEIERLFRIDDRVLKYMTVLLEKDVDIENLKEEIARKKAEDDQSDQIDNSEDPLDTAEALQSEAIDTTNQSENTQEEL